MLDTVEQFDTLEFISHHTKFAFEPSQTLVILGFRLNYVKMTISLTDQKTTTLAECCKTLMQLNRVKVRGVARVLGKITFSLPGVVCAVS